MGTPPAAYGSSAAIPLPGDDELDADALALLRKANDLNVARMLAGTRDMFAGSAGLVEAVFQADGIDPRLRELVILRSAFLLDCPYEWQANAVMAKNAGCSPAEIAAMTTEETPDGLDADAALVIAATDELTRTGTLTDAVLLRMRGRYSDEMCRKWVLVIAWFNLLGRFLNGCRVPLETGDKLGGRTSPLG